MKELDQKGQGGIESTESATQGERYRKRILNLHYEHYVLVLALFDRGQPQSPTP